MKRRWRIVLMRKSGQVLGTVEATDPKAAEKVAAIQFELLDEFQRRRLLVQELGMRTGALNGTTHHARRNPWEIQPTIKPLRYTKALRRPVATAPKARA
jgi:hypothetical protein